MRRALLALAAVVTLAGSCVCADCIAHPEYFDPKELFDGRSGTTCRPARVEIVDAGP